MTPAEVTTTLRRFSEWRLTEDEALIFEIGETIDVAVEMIERADLVEKALAELVADLEVRARWDREASKGIVACGATVYRNAKATLEKSK